MAKLSINPEEHKSEGYTPIPTGDHRIRIDTVEAKKSAAGNEMYNIKFKVSGQNGYLFYNLVFVETFDYKKVLADLHRSFGVDISNIDTEITPQGWEGKVGGCRVKHEAYNGDKQASVSYFLDKAKQEGLKDWSEGANTVQADTSVNEEEVPF